MSQCPGIHTNVTLTFMSLSAVRWDRMRDRIWTWLSAWCLLSMMSIAALQSDCDSMNSSSLQSNSCLMQKYCIAISKANPIPHTSASVLSAKTLKTSDWFTSVSHDSSGISNASTASYTAVFIIDWTVCENYYRFSPLWFYEGFIE